MNIPILIANILILLAFVIHTFVGDKELKINEPTEDVNENIRKRETWTMARCGWHWISFDLLFASVALFWLNIHDFFLDKNNFYYILAFYFLCYAIVWALIIAISKQFPKNYLKLGQWILLLLISGLIYCGTK